jgi:integrase
MGKMRLQNIQPAHIRQLYLLLDIGTPVNTVQSRAGHSKASATTDIYGHAMAHS